MQTMRKQMNSTRRTAWGSALVLALLPMTGGVAAAQDSGEWIDTKIIDQVLKGIGVRRSEQVIDYRERSPLVVPPNRALPPPQSSAALTRNPAWPKDPDVQRAREAKKNSRAAPAPWWEDNRPLTPAELAKGRTRGGSQRTAASDKPDNGLYDRLWPSQLGYKGGLFSGSLFGKKDEVVQFKGEPPRASLTDPPVGYRTPSTAQPYGILTKQKPKAENSYITRGESK